MEMLKETYTIALPIVLTAFMGYIVWLLKNQKSDRDANSRGTMLLLRVQLIEYHDNTWRSKKFHPMPTRILWKCTMPIMRWAAMEWSQR